MSSLKVAIIIVINYAMFSLPKNSNNILEWILKK